LLLFSCIITIYIVFDVRIIIINYTRKIIYIIYIIQSIIVNHRHKQITNIIINKRYYRVTGWFYLMIMILDSFIHYSDIWYYSLDTSKLLSSHKVFLVSYLYKLYCILFGIKLLVKSGICIVKSNKMVGVTY